MESLEGPKFEINGKIFPVFNLTPHPFVWVWNDVIAICPIPSDGTIRLTKPKGSDEAKIVFGIFKMTAQYNQPWNGFEIKGKKKADLKNVALIVSMPVAEYICQNDLFPTCAIIIPDSGPGSAVRNNQGQITGVKKIVIYRKLK